jgi:pre-rRNA-processing protein TSR2
MRLAISQEWGGPDSADKCDFIVSHICDLYGGEPGATSLGRFEKSHTYNPQVTPAAPATPDEEDLAEILEGYLADEFDARIEDESCDYIAGRISALHKIVFATPETQDEAGADKVLTEANNTIAALDEAAAKLRQKGLPRAQEQENIEEASGSESGSDEEDDSMDVDPAPREPRQKQEPIVDEDGFTTVVGKKKR